MIPIKHAGIFAAGLGTRLAKEFPGVCKPMTPILGKPLIDWTVQLLTSAGFESITILLNSKGKQAKDYLKKTFPDENFIFIVKDTASSYESFRLLSQTLSCVAENFILSAVDSFYKPNILKNLANFNKDKFDAVLTVTNDIRDEKPLWADVNEEGKITAMGDWSKNKKYATSGLYLITKKLAEEMPNPQYFKALRYYLSEITLTGKKIISFNAKQSVDIDTKEDISLAENFLKKYLSEKKCLR